MKYQIIILLFFASLINSNLSMAQPYANSFTNPVFTMKDGCVERFSGNYYAPISTILYTSKDLITWQTTNTGYTNGGAGDMIYRNGVYHAYWNGIGHGYASTSTGTYTNETFDDVGIDVQVFQDEDGKVYYVKKRNPSDPDPITGASASGLGPQVWTMKMNSPFSRTDITEGSMQLTHQPGHPTSLNMFNFEGPELCKHRGRYYLMYVSNRMGSRSGMYEIGVAESDGAMNFDNSKKYPQPILTRNTEQHILDYSLIAPTAEHGGWDAKYSTETPPANWQLMGFDDSSWTSAQGGFGRQTNDLYAGNTFTNALIRARKTAWDTTNIFIRRKFTLAKIPTHLALKHWVYGNANLYLNGNKITLNTRNNTYSYMTINPSQLVVGENIISAEVMSPCSDIYCQQFIDFGLYDTGTTDAEDVVIGPGQPNFVVGPNGFERWMMYKAFFNGTEKQGVDRIHFYNKEMVVDNSTVKNTKTYRPKPALPTYINYCETEDYHSFDFLKASAWKISDGIFYPLNVIGGELLFRKQAEANYRLEMSFRISQHDAWAGVYAYYKDAGNWLKIHIGRNKTWKIEKSENGTVQTSTNNLPADFEFLDPNPLVSNYAEPWHTLAVYKNGSRFKVELDAFNLTLNAEIETNFTGAGAMGLTASSDKVAFDAIQYTAGYEEYDNLIHGWENATGNWNVTGNGLSQSNFTGSALALKGDFAWNYEFSTFIKNDKLPVSGAVGYYPLYIDANNYVKASINYATKTLDITGKEAGKAIANQTLSLQKKVLKYYTVMDYPTSSYQYDLRNESLISGVDILWLEGSYPYLNQTFELPKTVQFYALQNGSWNQINAQLEGILRFSYMNHFTFPATKANAIKMVVTNNTGKYSRAFSAYFQEDITAGYYLRCRREEDGLHIFVDDTHQTVVTGGWGKSRIGLFTENQIANFNGILHYQSGSIAVKTISINTSSCRVGESEQLITSILPINATNAELAWTSSDSTIVSVTQTGVITRKTNGIVSITAYSTDGSNIKGSLTIGETSINKHSIDEKLIIYPNPTSNTLYYKCFEKINTISIYSVTGKEMIAAIPDGTNQINMEKLVSGIYLFEAKTDKGTITKRFEVAKKCL